MANIIDDNHRSDRLFCVLSLTFEYSQLVFFAVGPEMIEALPPPPMFCSVCENDTTNCCTEPEEPNNLYKEGKPKKQIMKKGFMGNDPGFSTLPNPRSHSFGSKKPGKDDCKAGIQV